MMQGAITTNSLHTSLTLPRELNARRVKSKLQKYIFRSLPCDPENPSVSGNSYSYFLYLLLPFSMPEARAGKGRPGNDKTKPALNARLLRLFDKEANILE